MMVIVWVAALASAVFLGRWGQWGLAPDASLYAGLALKIHNGGHPWRLSATENVFPLFFEHPPYFFQWGAGLFHFLPAQDGVARWMGALPALIGLWSLLLYFARKRHPYLGVIAVLLLLATGHFTKYASTAQLEGPLFLGVLLVFLGSLEWSLAHSRSLALGMLSAGALIATAAKGVAGLGPLLPFLVVASRDFFQLPRLKSFAQVLWVLFCFALPFLLWALMTYSPDPQQWSFLRYLKEQVLRSATSNRANPAHSLSGSRFYYASILLKNLPHLTLWAAVSLWQSWSQAQAFDEVQKKTIRLGLLFFGAYFVPFSLVRFQLPHYLHPVYFCLALMAAAHAESLARRRGWEGTWWKHRRVTAAVGLTLAAGLAVFLISYSWGVTRTPNRGQEFIQARDRVLAAAPSATLWLSRRAMDPYRMEAFALWYFHGRRWRYVEDQHLKIQAAPGDLLWDPAADRLSNFGGRLNR